MSDDSLPWAAALSRGMFNIFGMLRRSRLCAEQREEKLL
jgi:hypothetical protein